MDDIIANDESSISIGLSKRKGRSEIGKRLNKITKDNKVFVKYTLIMAISTKGVVAWKLYEKGGIDHLRLIDFLGTFIKNMKNKLILMDNASSHKKEDVQEYIKNKKNDFCLCSPLPSFSEPDRENV